MRARGENKEAIALAIGSEALHSMVMVRMGRAVMRRRRKRDMNEERDKRRKRRREAMQTARQRSSKHIDILPHSPRIDVFSLMYVRACV